MVVESSLPVVVLSSSVECSSKPGAPVVDPTFDERWAAWRAGAFRDDMAVHRGVRAAALIAAVILGLVAGFVIIGGSL